jgi:hypothetical protein
MYDYLSQTFSLAGGTLGRVSFIVFIVGLLVQRLSERIVLWALAALQVIVNGMVIIIIFVQCPGHASAIWDHSGKSKCWDLRVQEYYGYFQGGELCKSSNLIELPMLTNGLRNSFQCHDRPIPCRFLNVHFLVLELEATCEARLGGFTGHGHLVR